MLKTTVYIVRHSETFFNSVHRYIGCGTDHPLDDRGKAQAATLRQPMLKKNISRIYSSPMKRTVMTAEQIRADRDIEIVRAPEILEIDCGQWEGKNRDEIEARWPGQTRLWQFSPDKLRIEDGETANEVQERAVRGFCDIVKKEAGNEIALVSHMFTIQAIMAKLLNIPLADLWQMEPIGNASITTMEIYENGDFEVIDWANEEHLPVELKNTGAKVAGFEDKDTKPKYGIDSVLGKRHFDGFKLN